AGEADQFPTDLVAVAAVGRIGEEPFHGVRVEHLEERGRRERLEHDPPGLEPLEHLVLLHGAQLVEALPVGALTMAIGLGDARTVELLRREGELVALLRRALAPGPLAIVLAHGAERSGELAIDEVRDAGFTGSGCEAVRR